MMPIFDAGNLRLLQSQKNRTSEGC